MGSKVVCPKCKNIVELKKHISKCKCGARLKVLE